MYKFELATSSARLMQRWKHSVLPSDVNIGGMATILPCHFHDQETEPTRPQPSRESRGNVELDD